VEDLKRLIWKSGPIIPIVVKVSLSGRVVPDIHTFPAPNAMVRETVNKRRM
jgi:hypothetical protein